MTEELGSVWVMLEEDCVTPCCVTRSSASSESVMLSLDTLERVSQVASHEDLPLFLLAGVNTVDLPRYTRALGQVKRTWLVPPGIDLPSPEQVIEVVALKDALKSSACRAIVTLRYSQAEIQLLPDAVMALAAAGAKRVSVVLEDLIEADSGFVLEYRKVLSRLAQWIAATSTKGCAVEIDILTDRLLLPSMRNCSAGVAHITLGPNGHFYACPHFYHASKKDFDCASPGDFHYGQFEGDFTNLGTKNRDLLRFERAPVCQACDAYHCHRCVYLNWFKTLEPCVPSKIQCMIATTERNVSAELRDFLVQSGVNAESLQPIPPLKFSEPYEYCESQGYPTPIGSKAPIYAESPRIVGQPEEGPREKAVITVEMLYQEIRRLQERVKQLEQWGRPSNMRSRNGQGTTKEDETSAASQGAESERGNASRSLPKWPEKPRV